MQLLMLPSAHSAVLVIGEPTLFERMQKALCVFGVLMVLLGSLDLMTRIPEPAAGDTTLRQAFAPAVLMVR